MEENCRKKTAFQQGAVIDLPIAGTQQQCPQTSLGSPAHFSQSSSEANPGTACPGLAACPQLVPAAQADAGTPRAAVSVPWSPGNTCCSTETAEGITSPVCSRIRNEVGFFFLLSLTFCTVVPLESGMPWLVYYKQRRQGNSQRDRESQASCSNICGPRRGHHRSKNGPYSQEINPNLIVLHGQGKGRSWLSSLLNFLFNSASLSHKTMPKRGTSQQLGTLSEPLAPPRPLRDDCWRGHIHTCQQQRETRKLLLLHKQRFWFARGKDANWWYIIQKNPLFKWSCFY